MLRYNTATTRDLLRIWFSWEPQALFAALIVFLLISAYAYLASSVYTARAMILLLPRTSEGAVITSGMEEKRVTSVSIEDVNTEIELMKCNDVAAAAVRSFRKEGTNLDWGDTTENLVRKCASFCAGTLGKALVALGLTQHIDDFQAQMSALQKSLSVKSKAFSNIIEVSLSARQPLAAATALNRFLEVYVDHHNRVFTIRRGREFLQEQTELYGRTLDSAERAIDDYRRRNGILDPRLQSEKMVSLAAELDEEVKRIEISEEEIKAKISVMKDAMDREGGKTAIIAELRAIPEIAEIEKALVPLLAKKSELSATYTEQSREYQVIENHIDAFYRERAEAIGQALAGENLELENLSAKRAALLKKIASMKTAIMDLNGMKITIGEMERSAAVQQQNFILYASKKEDARVTAENLGNVAVADYAEPPQVRSFPNRPLMLLAAFFFGIFILLITPYILEMFDMRLKTPADVEGFLSIPVICSIPIEERGRAMPRPATGGGL